VDYTYQVLAGSRRLSHGITFSPPSNKYYFFTANQDELRIHLAGLKRLLSVRGGFDGFDDFHLIWLQEYDYFCTPSPLFILLIFAQIPWFSQSPRKVSSTCPPPQILYRPIIESVYLNIFLCICPDFQDLCNFIFHPSGLPQHCSTGLL
jgi:hypothetical protein